MRDLFRILLNPFHWSHGAAVDCELDNADREPSLGAIECMGQDYAYPVPGGYRIDGGWDQTRWACGDTSDLENDPAEQGEPEDGI